MGAGRVLRAWWTALTFLTILPAPRFKVPEGGLGVTGHWFPVVGLLIGGLLWAVQAAAATLFDPLLTGLLVTVVWAVVTGGLHLDGLADCGDGVLASVSRERRLEILRDPRLGSFGALTLFLALLLKAAAAGSAPGLALLLAPTWARWLLLMVARQPQARPGGLGATFAAGMTATTLIVALLAPLLLLVVGGALWLSLSALMFAALVSLGVMRMAQARLGGVTGDVLGLTVELSEIAVLLVFVAWAGIPQ